ncbi:hypothetical protein AB0N06_25315 [Streptomyces sp. NPDC051020]|uniref:hypothetical protein n=1 Tax=Streptomyces sp. NPDC051020 TaxID=3155409 RepID=UPI003419FA9D
MTGVGRSLLLNGHIDVVSAEPRSERTGDPFRAEVRDGRLYDRTCDISTLGTAVALLLIGADGHAVARTRRAPEPVIA